MDGNVDDFWTYSYSSYPRMRTAGRGIDKTMTSWARSRQKVDVTDFSKLTFTYGGIETVTSSSQGGYLDFRLLKSENVGDVQKQARKSYSGSTGTGESLTIDVSGLQGEYYLCVYLCNNKGDASHYVQLKSGTKTIIGYP